ENTFDDVIEVALVTKDVLDRAGVTSFVKTSGATGMHVFVPLGAMYSFDQARQLAHKLAQVVHQKLPELTSLERNPKERRYRVYLDFLQNSIGQTIASPYSVRPKPGAPVSTPLNWEEVKPGLTPQNFTIKNVPERIRDKGDLFKGVLGKGIDLLQCLQRLKLE
ncbi:MAG: DNA ligase, partial [Pontibacter sp.]|nr:DNA ligase [Pontibacter sp.]